MDEGGDADADEPAKARRRPPAAGADPSATLEDADALRVKEFDPTFAVDPLFRKTSAQFDEGGAKGAPTVPPGRRGHQSQSTQRPGDNRAVGHILQGKQEARLPPRCTLASHARHACAGSAADGSVARQACC